MTTQHHPALTTDRRPTQHLGQARRLQPAPPRLDFEEAAIGLARWYVEFRAGRRTWDQVQAIVSTPVRQRLRMQTHDRRPAPSPNPVVRARIQRAGPRQVEAVVLVREGARVIAVTVAFQRTREDDRWQVVDLTTLDDDDRNRARNEAQTSPVDAQPTE